MLKSIFMRLLSVDNTRLFNEQCDEAPGGPNATYRTHFERRTRLAGAHLEGGFERNETPPQKHRLVTKRLS